MNKCVNHLRGTLDINWQNLIVSASRSAAHQEKGALSKLIFGIQLFFKSPGNSGLFDNILKQFGG
jgi:hypothetical protein